MALWALVLYWWQGQRRAIAGGSEGGDGSLAPLAGCDTSVNFALAELDHAARELLSWIPLLIKLLQLLIQLLLQLLIQLLIQLLSCCSS